MNSVERAKSIFMSALDRDSAADRAAYVEGACGGNEVLHQRVERLLAAHERDATFLEPSDSALTLDMPTPIEASGATVGPFKLREQIGEGGFGVVYVAEQMLPVRRKIALKIIKPGMNTKEVIARFEAERQLLALMDHPNIARIYDAGSTESGMPYFAMELVRGLPITAYCDTYKLTTEERLKLFVTVCRAVQHAHLKGIIHRDLKPSNVLVMQIDGAGVPKVIDFGVAKATNQQLIEHTIYTKFAQMIGTPMYMSPEQAELSGVDIDMRTDVYSLGVLLYELLTGCTPFDRETMQRATFDEMRRIIRESEPPRPSMRISTLKAEDSSTLSQQRGGDLRKYANSLRGELDWLVMKALDKDRNRRYESASAFAADVERFLDNEPVEACPPSTWYRLYKFARRRRGLLATATLLAVMMFVAAAVSIFFAVQADQEKDNAVAAQRLADKRLAQSRLDFDRAIKALDVVVKELSSPEFAQIPGVEQTRSDVLQQMLTLYEAIAKEHGDDPYARQQQALAFGRISGILLLSGQREQAEVMINQGVSIVEKLLEEHPDDKEVMLQLSELLFSRFHHQIRSRQERLSDAERALALREQLIQRGDSKHAFLAGLLHLKVADVLPSNSPDIDKHLAESIRVPESHGITPHWAAYIHIAERAAEVGNFAKAEENYRRGIAHCRESAESNHSDRMNLSIKCSQFAMLLSSMGRADEAHKFHIEALDVARKLCLEYGKLPFYERSLAICVDNYVQDAKTKPQKQRAIDQLNELGAILDGSVQRWPDNVALHKTRANLMFQTDNAVASLTAAIEEYPDQPYYYSFRGRVHRNNGELPRALEDYSQALQRAPGSYESYGELHRIHCSMGEIYLEQKQYQEAVGILTPACNGLPGAWWIYKRRAMAHFRLGQYDEALADVAKALELNPEDTSSLRWISLDEVAVRPDKAFRQVLLELADKTIERTDHAARAYATRGRILAALGQEEKAIADLNTAFGRLPAADVMGELSLTFTCNELSNLCAALAHRPEVILLMRKLTELQPEMVTNWYYSALALLASGQADMYRDTCRRMLLQFQDTDSISDGNTTAWTCVLAPDAVDDHASVVRLAERAEASEAKSFYFLNTLGTALYRAGRADEALKPLTAVNDLIEKPDHQSTFVLAINSWVLAMVHHQLGNERQAGQWLKKADKWTDTLLREHEEGTSVLPWERTLTLHVFRQEATVLIGHQHHAEID